MAKFGQEARKAIPRLLLLVDDQTADVRRFLAFSLGRIGLLDERIDDALEKLNEDPDLSVRVAAACASLQLGVRCETSFELLLSGINQADSFVRFLAASSLGDVGMVDRERTVQLLELAAETENSGEVMKVIEQSLHRLREVSK